MSRSRAGVSRPVAPVCRSYARYVPVPRPACRTGTRISTAGSTRISQPPKVMRDAHDRARHLARGAGSRLFDGIGAAGSCTSTPPALRLRARGRARTGSRCLPAYRPHRRACPPRLQRERGCRRRGSPPLTTRPCRTRWRGPHVSRWATATFWRCNYATSSTRRAIRDRISSRPVHQSPSALVTASSWVVWPTAYQNSGRQSASGDDRAVTGRTASPMPSTCCRAPR